MYHWYGPKGWRYTRAAALLVARLRALVGDRYGAVFISAHDCWVEGVGDQPIRAEAVRVSSWYISCMFSGA